MNFLKQSFKPISGHITRDIFLNLVSQAKIVSENLTIGSPLKITNTLPLHLSVQSYEAELATSKEELGGFLISSPTDVVIGEKVALPQEGQVCKVALIGSNVEIYLPCDDTLADVNINTMASWDFANGKLTKDLQGGITILSGVVKGVAYTQAGELIEADLILCKLSGEKLIYSFKQNIQNSTTSTSANTIQSTPAKPEPAPVAKVESVEVATQTTPAEVVKPALPSFYSAKALSINYLYGILGTPANADLKNGGGDYRLLFHNGTEIATIASHQYNATSKVYGLEIKNFFIQAKNGYVQKFSGANDKVLMGITTDGISHDVEAVMGITQYEYLETKISAFSSVLPMIRPTFSRDTFTQDIYLKIK